MYLFTHGYAGASLLFDSSEPFLTITVNPLTLPPSHRYYLVIWNFNCIFVAVKQKNHQ